jgi:hypothetical protein
VTDTAAALIRASFSCHSGFLAHKLLATYPSAAKLFLLKYESAGMKSPSAIIFEDKYTSAKKKVHVEANPQYPWDGKGR